MGFALTQKTVESIRKTGDMSSTARASEIEKFSKDAASWWDPDGPFAPLHRLNPARLSYLKQQICAHYGREMTDLRAFEGLRLLDIGCGGGLVCEPLARLGGAVTGIDADPVAIEVAKKHAEEMGLKISYSNETTDTLLSSSRRKPGSSTQQEKDPGLRRGDALWDVVLALEIIEHVAAPAQFVKDCARLVKPGGLVIFSTLNRTMKSYALGIIAAEHILRWVPRGTHEWRAFLRPSELSAMARQAGLTPQNISGLIYNPLKGDFEISQTDIDVNYFMNCKKS